MCKKMGLGVLGLILAGGFLFGGNLIPYVTTAYNKTSEAVQGQVPVSFQIDAAKEQLKKIQPEIKQMVWQIAKEKAELKRLAAELEHQEEGLDASKGQMMTLREHLDSGEQFYVATNGKNYANSRVKEDLAHRFSVFKTAQKTFEKSEQIRELRESALETALTRLDEAQAQQRELEVRIENLTARQRMVEVAQTASGIKDLDNSQLAQTREMIDQIDARIDTEEELLNLAPKYFGQIPVGDEEIALDADVVQEFDQFFSEVDNSTVTAK